MADFRLPKNSRISSKGKEHKKYEFGAKASVVVGKNGARIRSIGEASRRGLEDILGRRVHLFLHVKVKPDWMEKPEHYRELGLDFKS